MKVLSHWNILKPCIYMIYHKNRIRKSLFWEEAQIQESNIERPDFNPKIQTKTQNTNCFGTINDFLNSGFTLETLKDIKYDIFMCNVTREVATFSIFNFMVLLVLKWHFLFLLSVVTPFSKKWLSESKFYSTWCAY